MTTTDSAVRARVANLSALILTNQPNVAEWVRRYFGSWWRAELEPLGAGSADLTVLAQVDHTRHDEITSAVDAVPHETISYARKEMRLVRTGGAVTAYSADGVAYTVADGAIGIAGTDPAPVGSAACRLAREALRGALARNGWVLLHASAVVRDGRAYLACGTKGSGKTATALQLANATGGALLANDRVFARADADGTVVVLPWPAAAAVGLGLLDATGWYDAVVDVVGQRSGSVGSSVAWLTGLAWESAARSGGVVESFDVPVNGRPCTSLILAGRLHLMVPVSSAAGTPLSR